MCRNDVRACVCARVGRDQRSSLGHGFVPEAAEASDGARAGETGPAERTGPKRGAVSAG